MTKINKIIIKETKAMTNNEYLQKFDEYDKRLAFLEDMVAGMKMVLQSHTDKIDALENPED